MLVEWKEDACAGRFFAIPEPEPVIPGLIFGDGVKAVADHLAEDRQRARIRK